mgnify:CR=1 FL=1
MAAITDLSTLTGIANADWLVVHDLTDATDKKISRQNLIAPMGAWTPTIEGTTGNPSSVTFSTATGWYIDLGGIVIASFSLITSAISGGSGSLRIAGLPIAATSSVGIGAAAGKINMDAGYTQMTLSPISGTTKFYVLISGDNVASGLPSISAWGNDSDLSGTLIYKVI